jgi:magnesium-transporting ATPase (P-type)
MAHTSIDLTSMGEDIKDTPVDVVLAAFKVTLDEGLTEASAARRLEAFGPNEIVRVPRSKILQFLSFVLNPLSYVMELAAIVSIAVANGGGLAPDWQDFIGIVFLLLLNASVGYYEESKAGDAVDALMASLSLNASVKRGGKWATLEAKYLVPGDIVAVKLGDIVPADVKVLQCENVKVDQAAMTGESLPVGKEVGGLLFSGSTIKVGEAEGVVVSTGANTFFGKTAALVSGVKSVSHFQKVLTTLGTFCVGLIFVFEVVVILVQYIAFKYNYRTGINNVLVLLIGGIPIGTFLTSFPFAVPRTTCRSLTRPVTACFPRSVLSRSNRSLSYHVYRRQLSWKAQSHRNSHHCCRRACRYGHALQRQDWHTDKEQARNCDRPHRYHGRTLCRRCHAARCPRSPDGKPGCH